MRLHIGSWHTPTHCRFALPPLQLVACNAAPFNDHNPSDSVEELSRSSQGWTSSSSSSSSGTAAPADGFPAPATSSSSSSQESPATTPRALTPSAAQQLEQLLLELLPKPPVSTPLTPMLSVMLAILQPNLGALPPQALLWVVQLCNAAGAGHTPSPAWLNEWAAALHTKLPRVSSETACWMLAEVLSLRQAQLPEGLLDDLFVGVLKEPCSCGSASMAAVLMAVAAAELAHSNDCRPTQQQQQQQGGSSTSSTSGFGGAANVTLASWRSGFYSARGGSSGRSSPDVSGVSQLYPLALHCCVEELGQGDRLAQLQPAALAGVAAATAALQLRLPAGWLDRWVCQQEGLRNRPAGVAASGLGSMLNQVCLHVTPAEVMARLTTLGLCKHMPVWVLVHLT
jgi:hypothetical protein